MNSDSTYLSVLAKLFQEDDNAANKNAILSDNLFNAVNGLTEYLSQSHYTNASSVIEELNDFSQQLDHFLSCSEMHIRKKICISGSSPSLALKSLSLLFRDQLPKAIQSLSIKSPILLTNGNSFELIAVTYAEKRVSLLPKQLELLIQESQNRGFNLNKLIKYLVIINPLNLNNVVLLLDNDQKDGYKLFSSFFDKSMYLISEIPDKTVIQHLHSYNTNLLLDQVLL